jgi:hypothetical protein
MILLQICRLTSKGPADISKTKYVDLLQKVHLTLVKKNVDIKFSAHGMFLE